jgi:hypothetical protein
MALLHLLLLTVLTFFAAEVWTNVAPIVGAGKLKAIFLECSYGDERSDDKLYGHLNPRLFMQEIGVLAQLVAERQGQPVSNVLKGLKVVVIHVKADDLIYRRQESAYESVRRYFLHLYFFILFYLKIKIIFTNSDSCWHAMPMEWTFSSHGKAIGSTSSCLSCRSVNAFWSFVS